MKTIEQETVVAADGTLRMTDLPFAPGEKVIVTIRQKGARKNKGITAAEILDSEFLGSWEGRDDLPDSPEYARAIREDLEKRSW